MSKQRPSANGRAMESSMAGAIDWRRRVFKNTYTRRGRTLKIHHWSVKIQYQGMRHTVSLSAARRADAAIEARVLHQKIVVQGWQAVLPARGRDDTMDPGTDTQSLPRTDVRYWKPRLIRRHLPFSPNQPARMEYSARIEHASMGHYFPLRTLNEDSAAERARDIYSTVVNEGWETACRRFSRELTIALHWADNPLAWTYATFQTTVGDAAPPLISMAARKRHGVNVILVERDDGMRRALADCVSRQPGVVCTHAVMHALDASGAVGIAALQLVLVNRNVPETAATFRRHRIATNLPVLFYTTHEDSDQLFKATPGGASAYLLRRTPPDRLLEPIADAVNDKLLTRESVAAYVRRYFHDVTVRLSSDHSAHDLAKLTHREDEILNLLAKGYADKEVADTLGISAWTVHGHLKRIFEKLGVHTRTEAAIKYLHK